MLVKKVIKFFKQRANMIYILTFSLLIVSITLFFREIRVIENTFDGKEFFFTYLIMGFIATILIIFLFFYFFAIHYDYFKSEVCLFSIISFSLIFFLVFHYINRYNLSEKTECSFYQVEEKQRNKLESFLVISFKDHFERVIANENEWDRIQKGDMVYICSKNGGMGYPIIQSVKAQEDD